MQLNGDDLIISPIADRVVLLRRVLAFFAVLLFATTWRLWVSPPTIADPQIPWFSFLTGVPFWIDIVSLGIMGVGLAAMFGGSAATRFTRWSAATFVIGLAPLLLMDQHRLQPWAWQFFLIGMVLMLAPGKTGLSCWRAIVCSLYIWSAWSKMDRAFLDSHGQMLLNGLCDALNQWTPAEINPGQWTDSKRRIVVGMFPAGELLVGLLLIPRMTRTIGMILSVLMHCVLLATLGLGLKHEPGVLIWNLFFIVQNVPLFRPDATIVEPATAESRPVGDRLAWGFTAIVVLLPLAESWSYYDHWPAWAVYCARPEQMRVLIDESAVEGLPPELSPFIGPAAPFEERRPLLLEAWSFQERKCPIYPQERYRLGLVLGFLDGKVPDEAVSVEIASTPDRWTGLRQRQTLTGLDEVRKAGERFWGNVGARHGG